MKRALWIFAVLFSASSMALNFGTKEELIAATHEGVQPRYIKAAVQAFSEHVVDFQKSRSASSPDNKLALFVACAGIIAELHVAAANLAAGYPALGSTREINQQLGWAAAEEAADEAAREVAFFAIQSARQVTRELLEEDGPLRRYWSDAWQQTLLNIADVLPFVLAGRDRTIMGFRVVEMVLLNFLTDYAEIFLTVAFKAAKKDLCPKDDPNPFLTQGAFERHRAKHFRKIKEDARPFLDPWIMLF